MQSYWLMFIGLLGIPVGWAQPLPYEQTFENFSPCAPDCRSACALWEDWSNSVTDDIDWVTWRDSTSISQSGPLADHTSGQSWGKYMLLTPAGGCVGHQRAYLLSPVFDFQNHTNPIVEFWYHLHGDGLGTLHLDAEIDGQWTLDLVPPLQDDRQYWQRLTRSFPEMAGSQVRFRLRGITGANERSEIAIDDFSVFEGGMQEPYLDQVLVSDCDLAEKTPIRVKIGNAGSRRLSQVKLRASINGQPWSAAETFPLHLLPGADTTLELAFRPDLRARAPHRIEVAIQQTPGTNNPGNDSLSHGVSGLATSIRNLPYDESFETSAANWQPGGTAAWEWGSPNGVYIHRASEGKNAWVTRLNGIYPNNSYSYLESPCFVLPDRGVTPILLFDQIFQLEAPDFLNRWTDGFWVEASTDGGYVWNRIEGGAASLENWYDPTGVSVWAGTSSGGAGNWSRAAIQLNGLRGIPFRIRFVLKSDANIQREGAGVDRIRILLPYDLNISHVLSPEDTCSSSSRTGRVRVALQNWGYYPLQRIQAAFKGSSMASYTAPERVPGVLASSATQIYTFERPIIMDQVAANNLQIVAWPAQDNYFSNNFFDTLIYNRPPPPLFLGRDTTLCGGDTLRLRVPDNTAYKWDEGAQDSVRPVTTSGTYRLEITDRHGCQNRDSIRVEILPQITWQVDSLRAVSCHGEATGSLILQPSGGSGQTQVLWSDGETSRSRNYLRGGYHAFRIQDPSGCALTDSVLIPEPDPIQVHLNRLEHVGCPVDSNAFIDVRVSGGNTPYQYLWSNGATTEDITQLYPDDYFLSIKDARGCLWLSPVYSIERRDSLPSARFGFDLIGGTLIILDSSVNVTQRIWTFGDGAPPLLDESDPRHHYTQNGEYQIRLIAENSCGRDTFSTVVTVNTASNNPPVDFSWEIYPNPVVAGSFWFRSGRPLRRIEFQLTDLQGRRVARWEVFALGANSTRRFVLPTQLKTGVYQLQIRSERFSAVRRLIINP